MVSVERTLEYAQLDSEQPEQTSDHPRHRQHDTKEHIELENRLIPPPDNWPNEGSFEFRDVYMRYSQDTPHALKGVSFTVLPREKVVALQMHSIRLCNTTHFRLESLVALAPANPHCSTACSVCPSSSMGRCTLMAFQRHRWISRNCAPRSPSFLRTPPSSGCCNNVMISA